MAFLSSILSAQSFQDTIKRFPLSCLCAVLLFILAVSQNHRWNITFEEERFMAFFLGGFFIFGFFVLVRESLNLSWGKHYALSFLSFIAFGLLIFSSGPFERHVFFIFPALLLLIMSAPFIFRQSSDTAFWHFNAVLWINAKIGLVTAIILGGGISAALMAIDFLFGIDIKSRIYQDVWLFACILFAPFFIFSQIPRDFNANVAIPAYEVILKFIVNWLLAPLVLVYLIILYAYFGKILVEWELPKGHLATIITGFGSAGVVVYLISWPFRESGNVLVRLVHKYFFPALILPVIMMFISVFVRLQEYGLTEERYMIALAALWFAVVITLFLLNKVQLKYIPMILGVAMIVASFGPWGAISLSGTSQFTRLENLLAKNNILEEGKVVPLSGEIAFVDEKGINSILRYFRRRDELEVIQDALPLKEGDWKNLAKNENYVGIKSSDMLKAMGLDYISEYMTEKRRIEQMDRIGYYQNYDTHNVNIKGYDYFYKIRNIRKSSVKIPPNNKDDLYHEGPELEINLKESVLTIDVDKQEQFTFDMGAYAQEYDFTNKNKSKNKKRFILEQETANTQVRLILFKLQGRQKGDSEPDIEELGFYILINSR